MNIQFLSIWIIMLLFSSNTLTAQDNRAIGTWQAHLPYNNGVCLADAGNTIYCGTGHGLFAVNKADNSTETYTPVQGLSEIGIRKLAYNINRNALIIVYESANIDILQNGKVTNYSDIARSNRAAAFVNNVSVYNQFVFYACSFGIVVFDTEREEFADTYIIGPNGSEINVFKVATDGTTIWAATELGLFSADYNNPNLAFFNNWTRATDFFNDGIPADDLVFVNNHFYVLSDNVIFKLSNNEWLPIFGEDNWCIQSLNTSHNYLLVPEWANSCEQNSAGASRYTLINTAQNDASEQRAYWNMLRPVALACNETAEVVWASDIWRGLHKLYGDMGDLFAPNGPEGSSSIIKTQVFDITAQNSNIWVASGNITSYSTYNYAQTRNGYYVYRNGLWENYTPKDIEGFNNIHDILTVMPHPTNNKVYLGSYYDGLVEVDGNTYTLYNQNNSPLQTTVGDAQRCRVSNMAFDNEGNLWISTFGSTSPITVLKADGTWQGFTPTPTFNNNQYTKILVDDFNQKWLVGHKSGILVMNHGATIEDTSDDQYRLLRASEGQGNLPTNQVNCIVKDKEGSIWVGTDEGIAVFYCPFAVFNNGCEAVRPFVEVDGFGAFLLQDEVVRTIAIDGANRKWVGSSNGVWLFSEDGTETIHYFTENNSPLLSNNIKTIAVDGESGDVFIGTDKGIIAYKSNALDGNNLHQDVLVYPNPVLPTYMGDIAIKGLAENANVKITDVSGNLVFETTALGSQAIWSGYDYTGRRAASGVYLVFSTNSDGSDTFVSKFVIVR